MAGFAAGPAKERKLDGIIVQTLAALAILAVWQVAVSLGAVNRTILPSLYEVFTSIPTVFSSPTIFQDLGLTLFEAASAFVIASALGIFLGLVIGRSRRTSAEYEPLLSALYAIPLVLFFPLFVLFFGIGPSSKIAIGVATAFFPIALSTIAGLSGVDPVLVNCARLCGATRSQLLRHVMLPAALPVISTGLRMGLTISLLTVLGTETIVSTGGLGHSMVSLGEIMEIGQMYVYILIIVLVAAIINGIASWLEHRAHRAMGAE